MPKGKCRVDSYVRCASYREVYLKFWGDATHTEGAPSANRSARAVKYQDVTANIVHNKRMLTFEPPPKGWRKAARKVLPEVLQKCGYSEDEIKFVAGTKIFDIADAMDTIKRRRIELITPCPALAPLFTHHIDVALGQIFSHLTLLDRVQFSLTCTQFNTIARRPEAWQRLCLLHDRARVTDKHLLRVMTQYGEFTHSLSIQLCHRLTAKSLARIGDHCPNLRVLNAADNLLFNEAEQTLVFAKATKLQIVNISCNTFNPAILRPIGRIDQLKELNELNMAGRAQPNGCIIANTHLKTLDVRYCGTDLRVDCPQLDCLIADQALPYKTCTTQRSARHIVSRGASDPLAFIPLTQGSGSTDKYYLAEDK